MLPGKWTAAHVRPEIKQPQHKRNRPDIINRQRCDRRRAQPVGGFFDEIEGAFALLSPFFHSGNRKTFNIRRLNLRAVTRRSRLNVRWSFLIHPGNLPERSFMERIRQLQQTFADQKKEKPGRQKAESTLDEPQEPDERDVPGKRLPRQFFQTDGANHTVVVFGDALAAKTLPALRAASHRFTSHMIKTALLGQILHGLQGSHSGDDGWCTRGLRSRWWCRGNFRGQRGFGFGQRSSGDAHPGGNFPGRQLALGGNDQRTKARQRLARAVQAVQRWQLLNLHSRTQQAFARGAQRQVDHQQQQKESGQTAQKDSAGDFAAAPSCRLGFGRADNRQNKKDESKEAQNDGPPLTPLGSLDGNGLDIAEIEPFVGFQVAARVNAQKVVLAQPQARTRHGSNGKRGPGSGASQTLVFFLGHGSEVVAGDDEKEQAPAGNLRGSQKNGDNGAGFCPVHKAAWGVPIADGHKQSRRGGDERKIKNQQGINGQRQGDAVVKRALVFQAFDFAPGFSRFQAGRAEMLSMEFAITQGTEEPPTTLAGYDRLLLRVIETTGFALNQDGLAASADTLVAKQGGKNFNLQRCAARRAGRQVRLVEDAFQEPSLAFGALNQRSTHGLLEHDPGIADVIVQGTFLAVKSDYNVADITNHATEHFGEEPSGCPTIADATAFRRHHLDFAGHFPQGGAIFAQEKNLIRHLDEDKTKLDQVGEKNGRRRLAGTYLRNHYQHKDDHQRHTQNQAVQKLGRETNPKSGIVQFTGVDLRAFSQFLQEDRLAIGANVNSAGGPAVMNHVLDRKHPAALGAHSLRVLARHETGAAGRRRGGRMGWSAGLPIGRPGRHAFAPDQCIGLDFSGTHQLRELFFSYRAGLLSLVSVIPVHVWSLEIYRLGFLPLDLIGRKHARPEAGMPKKTAGRAGDHFFQALPPGNPVGTNRG